MSTRFAPEAADKLREAIKAAGGVEVFAIGRLGPDGLVADLDVVGLVRELARNSALATFENGVVELLIAPQFEKLAARRHIETLQAALGKKLGRDIIVRLSLARDDSLTTPSQLALAANEERQKKAEAEMENDPNVKAMRDAFDATIEDVSVR